MLQSSTFQFRAGVGYSKGLPKLFVVPAVGMTGGAIALTPQIAKAVGSNLLATLTLHNALFFVKFSMECTQWPDQNTQAEKQKS